MRSGGNAEPVIVSAYLSKLLMTALCVMCSTPSSSPQWQLVTFDNRPCLTAAFASIFLKCSSNVNCTSIVTPNISIDSDRGHGYTSVLLLSCRENVSSVSGS